MHDLPLISTIAAAFTAAWLLGLLTQWLRLSPNVGDLLAGVPLARLVLLLRRAPDWCRHRGRQKGALRIQQPKFDSPATSSLIQGSMIS